MFFMILKPYDICILGTGPLGLFLAQALYHAGHRIRIGSRSPAKVDAMELSYPFRTGTYAEMIQGADIVIYALQSQGAVEWTPDLGQELTGKIVLDFCLPVGWGTSTSQEGSLFEALQTHAPKGNWIKVIPKLSSPLQESVWKPDTSFLICGNDFDTKQWFAHFWNSMGWGVEDLGTSSQAQGMEKNALRTLESMHPSILQEDLGQ